MALVPCLECGTKISHKATECPICGEPDPFRKQKNYEKKVRVFIVLAVVIALIYGYFFAFPDAFSIFKK